MLWLIAHLPYFIRMQTGTLIGLISYSLAKERRYITQTNIRLCFPQLSRTKQEQLIRKTFISYGIGLIETATGWLRDAKNFQHQVTFIGLEKILEAKAKGRGVLLLGAHFSTLDFTANLLSLTCPIAVTYKKHQNALFDTFMNRGRLRNCTGVFERKDIRGALKHLKSGHILWYAPDQDYGPEHAVFAPFFGNTAATLTTTSRFANFNDSPVFMLRHHRQERFKGYEVEFIPVTNVFPSGEAVKDATLVNALIEKAICRYPDQYLWLHKRFKTQIKGKPASPYINIKTSTKKITTEQLTVMVDGAETIAESSLHDKILRLRNDLHMRFFPGRPATILKKFHSCYIFDEKSKLLRMRGINTITVDNIFRMLDADFMTASFYMPEGNSLKNEIKTTSEENNISSLLKDLAAFISNLDQQGIKLLSVELNQFIYGTDGFALSDPLKAKILTANLSYEDRIENLAALARNLTEANSDWTDSIRDFYNYYLKISGLSNKSEFKKVF